MPYRIPTPPEGPKKASWFKRLLCRHKWELLEYVCEHEFIFISPSIYLCRCERCGHLTVRKVTTEEIVAFVEYKKLTGELTEEMEKKQRNKQVKKVLNTVDAVNRFFMSSQ